MADVDKAKAVDIAGKVPDKVPVPTRINSDAEAASWIKQGGYKIPKDCKTIYVTEDRNVFWEQNYNAAYNHAFKNNLKLFTLNEWTK